jgi:hypothetical protein
MFLELIASLPNQAHVFEMIKEQALSQFAIGFLVPGATIDDIKKHLGPPDITIPETSGFTACFLAHGISVSFDNSGRLFSFNQQKK